MTTGSRFVRGSARRRRRTSSPFTFGSFKSRRTTASCSIRIVGPFPLDPSRNSSASLPSRATITSLRMLFFFSARSVRASSSGLSSTSSTILLSSIRSSSTECEIDCRPLVGGGVDPDAPPVPVHDPLDGGQADPDARELVLAVQTLEHAEQLVGVRHVEPGSVVLDEVLLL